jgi:ribosomal protein S18 acetylase RimI-like enzyme
MHPRPYRDLDDLERIKRLSVEGRLASPYSDSPHRGDIDWWLYYGSAAYNRADLVFLWEDETGATQAWMIFDPPEYKFDMAVAPALRGTAFEAAVSAWGEARLLERARAEGNFAPELVQAAAVDEPARIANLEARGYTGEDYLALFAQPLPAAPPVLPEGYTFLERMTDACIAERAAAHIDAFHSKKMSTAAYQHFMTAPDYNPALDIVAVAPDGQFAAYAMAWADTVTGVGYFEPVGTRHAFQRLGLGKAVLLEGMRRLHALGLREALVCAEAKNAGNLAFYQAAGFRRVNTIRLYKKKFNPLTPKSPLPLAGRGDFQSGFGSFLPQEEKEL